MPMIEVSDEVNARLIERIESFDDTASSIIKQLLDQTEGFNPRRKSATTGTPRPAEREVMPETRYWVPILKLLDQAGGRARGSDVINALEPLIEDGLTEADRDVLTMGEVRWRNRARFARLRLKELGYISPNSPRGIWEITDEGRKFLAERQAAGGT